MVVLRCRRCKQLINPDEAMVVVVVGRPVKWATEGDSAVRLADAPGRWHFRCAPIPVRQYVAAVYR